jgi:ABC-type multidrug transport system ATPase subunit
MITMMMKKMFALCLILLFISSIYIIGNRLSYGLLGPSGCGKTSLLKCLIGLLKIDQGVVLVDAELKGDHEHSSSSKTVGRFRISLDSFGYMPQENCLFHELSLGETFYYYGKLYGMQTTQLREKENFLIELLDLPDSSALVGTLSGGQLRRASFAVALLNKPKMLVLDEPTVGKQPAKGYCFYFDRLARR